MAARRARKWAGRVGDGGVDTFSWAGVVWVCVSVSVVSSWAGMVTVKRGGEARIVVLQRQGGHALQIPVLISLFFFPYLSVCVVYSPCFWSYCSHVDFTHQAIT